jgi:hypothetical protein
MTGYLAVISTVRISQSKETGNVSLLVFREIDVLRVEAPGQAHGSLVGRFNRRTRF